jgi:MFS family permease
MDQDDHSILARRWKLLLSLVWLASCAYLIFIRQPQIHWFTLADTDDNMRMMQVRALLGGQDWYDLRQYRMNPPWGADIHWSHLVDLPLAAIILISKPFVGGAMAEKIAIAVAPLLPLGVLLTGLSLTVRRLIAPGAWILGASIFLCFITAMTFFMPTRIDHHGWQLAMLALILAGLVDPRPMRGGLTIGTATALSLTIGLEMLPWLAIAGAGVVLRWIMDGGQFRRLRGYSLALSGGTAFGYLVFASYANSAPRCDALTPVYLSTMVLTGGVLFILSWQHIESRKTRISMAAIAAIILAGFFGIAWPQCLGRPEQVSPEMQRLWLDQISETKPIYTRSWPTIVSVSALIIGLIGNFWSLWRNRSRPVAAAWAPIALLSFASALMLLLETRVAGAAMLFSVPGAVAIGWAIIPKLRSHPSVLVRTFGVVAAFMLVSGLALQVAAGFVPDDKTKVGLKRVAKSNASCPTLPALHPIAMLPKAIILTFVDLGPRLITVTHHDAIAGPYHRNGEAVLDIHHALRGTADDARAVMQKHGATLLLICPDMSEATVYKSESPKGFYTQLVNGKVPAWLEPVALPAGSPFKLWRLAPSPAQR